MAIAFDTSNAMTQNSGGSHSGSYTGPSVGTLTNGIVVVYFSVAVWSGTYTSPSVTYNGVSMTLYASQINPSSNQSNFIFYLVNPPSGAQTVAWTQGSVNATFINAVTASYSGVNQTTPFQTSASSSTTTGTTASVTAPTISGSPWGVLVGQGGGNITANTLTTLRSATPGGNVGILDSNGGLSTGNVQIVNLPANQDVLVGYLQAPVVANNSSFFFAVDR